jgi:sugar phosphate isomerase/epimerase
MPRLKIALRVESLGLGAKAGIVAAGDLGLEGVELDATHGDTAPEGLSRTGRREIVRFITSRRLQLCALSGDFGIPPSDPRRVDELGDRMRRVIELAVDLGTFVVVAPAFPAPPRKGRPEAPPSAAMDVVEQAIKAEGAQAALEWLTDLAKTAANYARFLAVRTGLNDGATMDEMLNAAGEGAKAALDPAALVGGGFDPVKTAGELGKKIVHVYARDAVGPGTGRARVTALGEGSVNFEELLGALDGAGYGGFLVVEPAGAEVPLASVEKARNFLRQF